MKSCKDCAIAVISSILDGVQTGSHVESGRRSDGLQAGIVAIIWSSTSLVCPLSICS